MDDRQLRALKGTLNEQPSFLSTEVRKRLHDIGYTKIHFSSLSRWRECHSILRWEIEKQEVTSTVNMLLGSVLHLAFAYVDDCISHGKDWHWWQSLFHMARANDLQRNGVKVNYLFKGRALKVLDVDDLCHQFVTKDTLGITLQDLVVGTIFALKQRGFSLDACELPLSFIDAPHLYPIEFKGTLDWLVMNRGGLRGILDTKSYGLWGAYLHGTSPSKTTFTLPEVQYTPQFRHYHWLYQRKHPTHNINFYGFVIPTNLIPYKKAGTWGKVGDPKGPVEFLAEALDPSFVTDYEFQMKDWCNQVSRKNFTKLMPMKNGAPACPDCAYFNACINDSTASRDLNIFKKLAQSPEYDYLKE